MTWSEYQREAARFAMYPHHDPAAPDYDRVAALGYLALGLAGEAGEVAQCLKRILRDDGGSLTEERRLALVDECGDVLWYLAELARHGGSDLGYVAEANVEKLQSRSDRGVLHGSGGSR